jgi:hypothetical protein
MTKQKNSIFLKIPFETEFQTTSSLPNKFWSINEGYIFVLILHGVLTVENFGKLQLLIRLYVTTILCLSWLFL